MAQVEIIKTNNENYKQIEKFSFIKANRTINKTNIKDKEKDFLKYGCFLNEITINYENNHVLDGQHRLEAFKNLYKKGLIPENSVIRIKYIKLHGISEIEYCKGTNTTTKTWKSIDYINTNKALGIYTDIYPQLEKLIKNAPKLQYSADFSILGRINSKRQCAFRRLLVLLKYQKGERFNKRQIVQDFDNGILEITDTNIQRAKILVTELTDILNTLSCGSVYCLEDVAQIWIDNREDYSFEQWIKGFKKGYNTIIRLPKNNKTDWIHIINTIRERYIYK